MRLFSGLRIRSSRRTRARLCRCLSAVRAALSVGRSNGREGLPPRMVGMEWSTMHAGYNVGWKTLFYLPAVTPHQHGPRLPTSGPAPNLPPFSFLGSSRMESSHKGKGKAFAFFTCVVCIL